MPNPENQLGLLNFSSDVLAHEKIVAQAKILVASAITGDRGVSIRQVKRFYREHADTIVPSSVDVWAKANGMDIQEARNNSLKHIFAKDVKIAQEHQRGIERNGTIFTLSDVIKQGETKIQEIDAELTRRNQG